MRFDKKRLKASMDKQGRACPHCSAWPAADMNKIRLTGKGVISRRMSCPKCDGWWDIEYTASGIGPFAGFVTRPAGEKQP